MTTSLLAGLTDGAWNLLWLYVWLVSAIAASYLSDRKGYGDRPGLATGLILTRVMRFLSRLSTMKRLPWKVNACFSSGIDCAS